MSRNIFIGLAWPYANGSLHLGHASAFIGADILARYHRLKKDNVLFVSGSDCYGTPIAVEALERNVEPSEIAEFYHQEFTKTLIDGLFFSYDLYTKTTNETHTRVVQELFLDLLHKGLLYTKTENALYSSYLGRFLPDRFIEGTCPHCGFSAARGDQCDNCGRILDALELINPQVNKRIVAKDVEPQLLALEKRETEHFFLKLSAFQDKLSDWTTSTSSSWRVNASSFTKGFLSQGLHDRAVTRDTAWGVPIPLPGYESKRIYVWFEAVIGYLSASQLWAEQSGDGDAWERWWKTETSKHYYVHGKDNIPFHTVIWPAILMGLGSLHLPDQIISSEYLTLEGKQFSKSRRWAVWLPEFLQAFDGEMLRYFLITQGPENGDADFSWNEFQNIINGELIGTYGNLVNRTLAFTEKYFPQGVTAPNVSTLNTSEQQLLGNLENAFEKTAQAIEQGRFRHAFKEVLKFAQEGNRLIDEYAPWKVIKNELERERVENQIALILHMVHNIAILFSPLLPNSSNKILAMLGHDIPTTWEYQPLEERYGTLNVSALFKKIEDSEIELQKNKLPIQPD